MADEWIVFDERSDLRFGNGEDTGDRRRLHRYDTRSFERMKSIGLQRACEERRTVTDIGQRAANANTLRARERDDGGELSQVLRDAKRFSAARSFVTVRIANDPQCSLRAAVVVAEVREYRRAQAVGFARTERPRSDRPRHP